MGSQPTAPHGWYPDPQVPGQLRYWDGAVWTATTAPSVTPAPTVLAPPAAPASPPAKSGNKIVLGAAIALGAVVVLVIGISIGTVGRGASPVADSTPVAFAGVTEPTPTTAPAEPADAPAIVELADPVAFRAQAGGHLDDMEKDLDDLVVTVQEAGFWRLLSNSVELSFNYNWRPSTCPPR